jgi:hypothetical protein
VQLERAKRVRPQTQQRKVQVYEKLKKRVAPQRNRRRDVRVEHRDGRVKIRIEVNGKVIEKTLSGNGTQHFDIPLPGGGKVRVQFDGLGGIQPGHGPDGGPNFSRARRMRVQPGRAPNRQGGNFAFEFDGDPEQFRKHMEQFGRAFGRDMGKWGEQFGKRMERGFGKGDGRGGALRELRELRQLDPKVRGMLKELMQSLKGGELEGLRDGMKGFRKQLERMLEGLEGDDRPDRSDRSRRRPEPKKAKKSKRSSKDRRDRSESF